MAHKIPITHLSDYEFEHIIHLSDLHIRPIERHNEFEQVFDKLYKSLYEIKQTNKNCLIVITGDIFDNPNIFTPEQFIVCDKLFNNLSSIYPLVVIAGNHDMKDVRRLDSISPSAYSRDNFYYLSKSGAYEIGSVVFSVTSLYDDTYSFIKRENIDTDKTCIALYHGTLAGSSNDDGYVFKNDKSNSRFRRMSEFNGYNAALLGDIHKMQSLTPTMWYSGSLIQQNYGETLLNHGYLLWDLIDDIIVTFHEITNDYGRVTIIIDNNEWKNPDITFPKKSYIRCQISNTIESKRNEIIELIKTTKQTEIIDVYIISNDKFLIDSISKTSNPRPHTTDILLRELENYNDNKINAQQKLALIELHKNYMEKIVLDKSNDESCLWYPLTLEFRNMFGYSSNYLNKINFLSGVTSITAPNASGKTSIINILFYTLFGDLLLNPGRSKNMDIINNKETLGYVKLEIQYGSNTYTIEKTMKRLHSKNLLDIKQKISYILDGKIVIKEQQHAYEKLKEMFGSIGDFYKCNVLNNRDQSNDFFRLSDGEKIKYLKQSFNMDYFDSLVKINKEKAQQIEKTLIEKNTTLTNLLGEIKTLSNDDSDIITTLINESSNLKESQLLVGNELLNYNKECEVLYKQIVLKENSIINQNNIDISLIKKEMEIINKTYKDFTIIYDLNKLKTDIAVKKSMLNIKITNTEDELKLKLSKILGTLSSSNLNLNDLDINKLLKSITQYETEIKLLNLEITNINNKLKNYIVNENIEITNTKTEIQSEIDKLQKQYKDKVLHTKQHIQNKINDIKSNISKYNDINMDPNIEQVLTNKILKSKDLELLNNKIKSIKDKMLKLATIKDTCDIDYDDILNEIEKLRKNKKPLFNILQKKVINMNNHKKNLLLYSENQIKIDELLKTTVTNELINDYIVKIDELCSKDKLLKKDLDNIKISLFNPLKTTLTEIKNGNVDEYRNNLKNITDNQTKLLESINNINNIIKENEQIDLLIGENNIIINNNKLIDSQIIDYEYHYNKLSLGNLEIEKDKIISNLDILNKNIDYNNLQKEIVQHETMLSSLIHNKNLDEQIDNHKLMLNTIEANELKYSLKLKENECNDMSNELKNIKYQYNLKSLENDKNVIESNLEIIKNNMLLTNEISKLIEQLDYGISKQKYENYLKQVDIYNNNNIYNKELKELTILLNSIKGNQKVKQMEQHKLASLETELNMKMNTITKNMEASNKLRKVIEEQEHNKKVIDIYGFLISPKCLQPIIIKKELKKLEISMNEILNKYTKYNVDIIYDDKNGIDIITKTKTNEKLTIERLSTYETLILTTAFKRSISKHTNKTRSKLYIIDESVENLDKLNFEKVLPELMRLLLEEYSHILIISQRDIQHIRDNEIKIIKKNNVSVIV